MKKLLWCLLIVGLLAGCGQSKSEVETTGIIYTDDLGRQVELPADIETVLPAGTVAQMMIYAVAPEKLGGLASAITESQAPYFPDNIIELPEFGSFYGGSGDVNYEAIIAAQPDVIIDMGEVKTDIVEDLDGFSEKTGIPIIFIEAELDTMGVGFAKLGALLDAEEQATALEAYCDGVLDGLEEKKGDGTTVLYVSTNGGIQVFGRNTVQVTVLDRVGAINGCPTDAVAGNGADTVNPEDLLTWNVDKILVTGDENVILEDAIWQQLPAVEAGEVYTIPEGPYQFLGRPPSVQQFLGIQWMGNFLYPETFDLDIVTETQTFYDLFFHYDLSDEEAETLLHLN